VAGVLVSAGWIALGEAPRRLEVTVLDVGQGEAILIETPSGREVLVDGGPGDAVLRGLGGELGWRDRSIDLVLLTHPQADHATGLLGVFDRYDVRSFASAGAEGGSMAEAALHHATDREGIDAGVVAAGDAFDLGDGVRLEVLWPQRGEAIDGNDGSLVLRLSWGDVRFLLTGDIEAAAEERLIASGADLRATVLKVAHHGSRTSSAVAFIDLVDPQVSVISAGAENPFGHPAPDVVERLAATSAVYVTAADGAVHFETDGERLWTSSER
jgi:competence protein ComEC